MLLFHCVNYAVSDNIWLCAISTYTAGTSQPADEHTITLLRILNLLPPQDLYTLHSHLLPVGRRLYVSGSFDVDTVTHTHTHSGSSLIVVKRSSGRSDTQDRFTAVDMRLYAQQSPTCHLAVRWPARGKWDCQQHYHSQQCYTTGAVWWLCAVAVSVSRYQVLYRNGLIYCWKKPRHNNYDIPTRSLMRDAFVRSGGLNSDHEFYTKTDMVTGK